MKNFLVIILVLFLGALSASAQNEPSTGLLRAEMSKLDKMVGQWKGSGWIQQGAKRETFSGTETVQKKIDGLALLVEGKFSDANGKIIHETLAVLSFDTKAKNYDFRTYLANGISGEHEFKLLSDGYEWGFQFPAGSVRYLIKTNNDVWFETGEFSKDGKTWIKIFEMKLDKVK